MYQELDQLIVRLYTALERRVEEPCKPWMLKASSDKVCHEILLDLLERDRQFWLEVQSLKDDMEAIVKGSSTLVCHTAPPAAPVEVPPVDVQPPAAADDVRSTYSTLDVVSVQGPVSTVDSVKSAEIVEAVTRPAEPCEEVPSVVPRDAPHRGKHSLHLLFYHPLDSFHSYFCTSVRMWVVC